MIVACFIQAVIAVMLLLIEVKKRGNTLRSYTSIKSQIFIFTAALQLSKQFVDPNLYRYRSSLYLLQKLNKNLFNNLDGILQILRLLPNVLFLHQESSESAHHHKRGNPSSRLTVWFAKLFLGQFSWLRRLANQCNPRGSGNCLIKGPHLWCNRGLGWNPQLSDYSHARERERAHAKEADMYHRFESIAWGQYRLVTGKHSCCCDKNKRRRDHAGTHWRWILPCHEDIWRPCHCVLPSHRYCIEGKSEGSAKDNYVWKWSCIKITRSHKKTLGRH